MTRINISFAGAGRVAGALAGEFHRCGFKIIQIVSVTETKGSLLAEACNSTWSADLIFNDLTDIVIVAVPDHSLTEVLSKIRCQGKTIVAHTAGSFGLEVFPSGLRQTAVFYPLQTFTGGRKIPFRGLPFLIEASDKNSGELLKHIAEAIGGKVSFTDKEQRKLLHLSAVFANNFTNYLMTSAKEISDKTGYSFDILKPLISETIAKVMENGPEESQTGPAIRNDLITIEKHLKLLSFSPELQKIYKTITQSIINHYKGT